jgi:hypothetical protein
VKRVVAGQGPGLLVQFSQDRLSLGGGAQREFAAGPAEGGRGRFATAVQYAADPRYGRVDR